MNELTEVFQDPFFWVGVGLFVFSILGIIWILKTFQKQPEETSLLTEPALQGQSDAKEKLKAKNPVTLDELSARLEKIERILSELVPKMQPSQEKNELTDEIRAISQTFKLQPQTADPKEIRELSAKLDKIYQVLVSLSTPNSK